MMLYHLLPFLLLAVAQGAVTASYNRSTSTTASTLTHTVDVAKGGFTFVPDVTLANVGDYVEFNFYPTNHSVVRAEYGYPCIPYEDTGVDKIGFFSGFRPVDAILSNPPKFTIAINNTSPIFFYCSAPGSCIGYGMVGVINPNATTSLATQRQLAMNSTFMLQPGEPWPSEGSANPFSTTATATAATTITSSTVTSSPNHSEPVGEAKNGHGLSSGGIAGIAVGSGAAVLVAAILLFFCGRRSRRNKHEPLPQSQYLGPKFMDGLPISNHETDVARYSALQRVSMISQGSSPPHDFYREAASTPVHEMSAQASQRGVRL